MNGYQRRSTYNLIAIAIVLVAGLGIEAASLGPGAISGGIGALAGGAVDRFGNLKLDDLVRYAKTNTEAYANTRLNAEQSPDLKNSIGEGWMLSHYSGEMRRLKGPQTYINSVQFTRNGRWVVACTRRDGHQKVTADDGNSKRPELFVWDAVSGRLLNRWTIRVAPRPFMVERGHSDGVGLDEYVAFEYAKVRRLYAQLGIADRTEIEFFVGGQVIRGQETFAFLHRRLHWPAPKRSERRRSPVAA